ncbi:hypothetical protein QBC34DRAFT_431201 [Podospora aff. communis PSN243]|uniref:Transmembrane protein n=1 Tax=Podospora aff. communis PSN243 TaxID=3040156 RepID=A0AAV9G4E7_9PEZI|nr:hypothetical protein QBC34DRAFT_431201 [Podospora aff. communis PSN243]
MASNDTAPIDCGFNGNPDLTGLGLRLSFYIQCITSALAAAFLNQHFDYIQSSSIAFFIATFAILVREVSNSSVRASEASVACLMLFFQALVIVYAEATHSLALHRRILRSVLLCASMSYGAWFWLAGLDRLPAVEGCVEYNAYYFRKIDLRSGANRTVNKVLFTFSAVVYGLEFAFLVQQLISGKTDAGAACAAFLALWRENAEKTSKAVRALLLGLMSWILVFFAGLLIATFAPAIELELKWNDIRDVQRLDTVGQLVPFSLSVGMLLHVVYTIFRQKDAFEEDDEATPATRQCPEKTKSCAEQSELLAPESRSGSGPSLV